MMRIGRRHFLMGAGGLAYALPALEGLAPRNANADVAADGFLMVYSQPMGVCQGINQRPETFWPNFGAGPLTQGALSAAETAGRSLGMLKDYAADVTMIRGVRHLTNGEGHEVGKAQVLTGSSYYFTNPNDHHSARGISQDLVSRYANEMCGGSFLRTIGHSVGDPVGQYSWNASLQSDEVVYNPSLVFKKIFTAPVVDAVLASRKSVNDLVLSELGALRASAKISSVDRQRLELHAESIRLAEKRLGSCSSPAAGLLERATQIGHDPENYDPSTMEEMHKMQLSMIALGLSCGALRSVQFFARGCELGRGTDMFDPSSREFQEGLHQQLHLYSHREVAAGEDPSMWQSRLPPLDRWHQRRFVEFLKQIKDFGILNQGVTLFHSEVGTGNHDQYNVPFVVAGNMNGRLQTGQYIDGGNSSDMGYDGPASIPNNKVLATIGAALGLKDNGAPIRQFGGKYTDGRTAPDGYLDALKGGNFQG